MFLANIPPDGDKSLTVLSRSLCLIALSTHFRYAINRYCGTSALPWRHFFLPHNRHVHERSFLSWSWLWPTSPVNLILLKSNLNIDATSRHFQSSQHQVSLPSYLRQQLSSNVEDPILFLLWFFYHLLCKSLQSIKILFACFFTNPFLMALMMYTSYWSQRKASYSVYIKHCLSATFLAPFLQIGWYIIEF